MAMVLQEVTMKVQTQWGGPGIMPGPAEQEHLSILRVFVVCKVKCAYLGPEPASPLTSLKMVFTLLGLTLFGLLLQCTVATIKTMVPLMGLSEKKA